MHRAVGGRAFFIRRQQQGNRAFVFRMGLGKFLNCVDEGRNRGFHIRRTTAIQLTVAHGGLKRGRVPGRFRPGRNHVCVTGKNKQGRLGATAGPQIGHRAAGQMFQAKARLLQPCAQPLLAVGVLRGDRGAGNQGFEGV